MAKQGFLVSPILVSLVLSVQCTQIEHKSESFSEESCKYTISQREFKDEEQSASTPRQLEPEPLARQSADAETSEFFWLALGFILGGMMIPILHHRYRAAEFTDEYLAEVYYSDFDTPTVIEGRRRAKVQNLVTKPASSGSPSQMATRSSVSGTRLRPNNNTSPIPDAADNSLPGTGTQIVSEFNNVVGLLEHELELFKSIRNPLV